MQARLQLPPLIMLGLGARQETSESMELRGNKQWKLFRTPVAISVEVLDFKRGFGCSVGNLRELPRNVQQTQTTVTSVSDATETRDER